MNWISNYVRPKINSLFSRREVPENLWTKCTECGTMLFHRELSDNLMVCTSCDHHMAITPRNRFKALFDGGVFAEVAVPAPVTDPDIAVSGVCQAGPSSTVTVTFRHNFLVLPNLSGGVSPGIDLVGSSTMRNEG